MEEHEKYVQNVMKIYQDNELAPYIGIYKANFQGNEISLFITKIEDKLEENIPKTIWML